MNLGKVFNAPKVQLLFFSQIGTTLPSFQGYCLIASPNLQDCVYLGPYDLSIESEAAKEKKRRKRDAAKQMFSLEHLFCSIVDTFKYYLYIIINIQIMNKNEKFRRMFNINNRTSKHLEDTASSFAYAFKHILSTRKGYTSWSVSEMGLGKGTLY